MMQQSCNGNMVGPCSCGYYHHGQTGNSFSMLFHRPYDQYDNQSSATASYYHQEMYDNGNHYPSSPPSSSSSAVDCTLSLGTPSTRLTVNNAAADAEKQRRSSYMPNFCWDILQSKQSSGHNKSSRGSYTTSSTNSGGGGGGGGGEGLNARRCANCDTTSTPLWRNGPKGPKSLCNACGIRFKKEERRASAAAASNGNAGSGSAGGMDVHHQYMTNGSWVQHHHSPAAQRIPYFSPAAAYGGHEFRFMEDVDDRDSDTGLPYLSWRLNVTDRPGLVHDFTR